MPMTTTQRISGLIVLTLVFQVAMIPDANAQRAGQSVTIRTGTVTGVRNVELKDGSAAGGAVVGGALGAAISGGRSSSTRGRNAAIGAILGGVAASASRTTGRSYTVATNDGTIVQVATEQTEIQLGDCVFIEESRGGTNIRRAPASACEPQTEDLLDDADVEAVLQQDAASCFAARQELADAQDDATFDRAVRKVKLLCYD